MFFSLADRDKAAGLAVAARFSELGFSIIATEGTAIGLKDLGIPVDEVVAKMDQHGTDAVGLIESGRVQLVVNTREAGAHAPTGATSERPRTCATSRA